MYRKHKAFWVIDASARFFNSTELTFFYNKVRNGNVEPFTAEHPAGHQISAGTNSKIYSYLPLPAEKGQDSGMRQALTMFVVRSKMSTEVIKWWEFLDQVDEKLGTWSVPSLRPVLHRLGQIHSVNQRLQSSKIAVTGSHSILSLRLKHLDLIKAAWTSFCVP